MTATASGVRSTCAWNTSGTVAVDTGPTVSFHWVRICCRSAWSKTSTRCSRAWGSAATASRTRASRCAIICAVAWSNRSAVTITDPRNPAGRRLSSKSSATVTSRSNFAAGVLTGSAPARTPGRPNEAGALFCTVSMTWNSGWRVSDRVGAKTSTRRSNGTSW